jgi:hypothetical protein
MNSVVGFCRGAALTDNTLFYGTAGNDTAALLTYATYVGHTWSPPDLKLFNPFKPAPLSVYGALTCGLPATYLIHRRSSSDATLYASVADWYDTHEWEDEDSPWSPQSSLTSSYHGLVRT